MKCNTLGESVLAALVSTTTSAGEWRVGSGAGFVTGITGAADLYEDNYSTSHTNVVAFFAGAMRQSRTKIVYLSATGCFTLNANSTLPGAPPNNPYPDCTNR